MDRLRLTAALPLDTVESVMWASRHDTSSGGRDNVPSPAGAGRLETPARPADVESPTRSRGQAITTMSPCTSAASPLLTCMPQCPRSR